MSVATSILISQLNHQCQSMIVHVWPDDKFCQLRPHYFYILYNYTVYKQSMLIMLIFKKKRYIQQLANAVRHAYRKHT